MAESAVDFLLQTLDSLVRQEASLLQGLRRNISEIQHELQSMRSFLKDADRRKRSDDGDGVRTWVDQVREATYKVEDIIDTYMYQIVKQHTREGILRRALYSPLLLPKRYYYKHRIASELQAIKSEIQEISERRQRYCFQEEGQTSKMKDDVENRRRSGQYLHFIPDREIVGIDEKKDFLIRKLTDERPKPVAVAVVGMGGLGKTTLVTKVYDSPQVKSHFDCHAWITVSESYKPDELMRDMILELYKSNKEAAPDDINKMKGSDLVQTVINYLQNKRYVIVLDDVWETIDWNDIRLAFPNNGRGSRIMLTTRIRNVALSFEAENIIDLEPLGEDDAWILFCNRAFSNKSCPPELEPYAKSIVQKCGGLPLAIVTIGGLMLTKEKSSLEWKKVENSLSWQLNNNKKMGGMKNILLLSFDDLPYNLKYCFLYVGLFPEDYQIKQGRLIKLWVAEGFIEEREGHTLEEVAEDYIKELTCRSMLQIIEDDFSPVRSVQMHDVLRELAISIGHEQNFCSTHDREEETWTNKARYLSMQNSIVNIQSSSSTCHHRSLMLFQIEIPSVSLCSISSRYKLLRVLDLRGSSIESVPDELVELFNLRYLDLRNTDVEELPKSIGRLQNLQTLNIGETKIKILPKGVEKLKKLRHMYMSSGVQAPDGIFNLNCLQSLNFIGINDDTVRKVGNLTQLRSLGIENVKRNHGKELSASLQRMEALDDLSVEVISEEEILDLDAVSSPPAHLNYLWLEGRLERLPPWIGSLQNLAHLALRSSHLREDPLSSLEALPNLLSLRLLMMAYVGDELCFRHGCFLKLKLLGISELPKLNLIKIENGSLTCIEKLGLKEIPELKRIPEGMQYLTSLQELNLYGMSEELIQRIKAGDERVNLLHIPFIGHFNSAIDFGEKIEIQAPIGDEDSSWTAKEKEEKEKEV